MKVKLSSFSTNAGYLEKCNVNFHPRLTCIIGARGTCKSTLIESIRFAFNYDENRIRVLLAQEKDDEKSPGFGLIKETLGGGTVNVTLNKVSKIGEEDSFSVERDIESEPRVYHEGVQELADSDLLEHIEVYSQGDLQRIAESEYERLKLIDRKDRKEIRRIQEERTQKITELRDLGPMIRSLRPQIERGREEMKGLEAMLSQLEDIKQSRPQLSEKMGELRNMHTRREQIKKSLQEALEILTEVDDHLSAVDGYIQRLAPIQRELTEFEDDDVQPAKEAIQGVSQALQDVSHVRGEIANVDLASVYRSLEQQFLNKDKDYFELLKQQQDLNDSMKKEDTLRKQIDYLKRIQEQFKKDVDKRDELLQKRKTLRSQIDVLNDKLFRLRLEEVDAINEKHGDVVLLVIETGSRSKGYKKHIMEMLAGSRIRSQDEVAADIVQKLPPSILIDVVEASDAQRLSDLLDRDLGQMTRVVSHLADHEALYEIEKFVSEDRLQMTMYDDGVPKPVENLSKGQKATALLPLILRPLPYPLIIDQPEDDLDNSFIYRSLIRTIKELKRERQLIFVTHNANIPVLGDADKIIVMNMETPKLAIPPKTGTVDQRKSDIVNYLEGGEEAFKEREKRYFGHDER